MSAGVARLNLMPKDYPVCYFGTMNASRGALLSDLESIVKGAQDRPDPLQDVAARTQSYGNYRWAGLYKVDYPVIQPLWHSRISST